MSTFADSQGFAIIAAAMLALLIGVLLGTFLGERSASRAKRLTGDPPALSMKKRKTSHIILLVLGLFSLVFITAMTVIFCVKGTTPDSLIQYTLGAGGFEALLLAGIRISKVLADGSSGQKEEP